MSAAAEIQEWQTSESSVLETIRYSNESCLRSYEVRPQYIEEHVGIEHRVAQGGYGQRQIFELVQNAADALNDHARGRVHVVLTRSALYCANEGEAITPTGVHTILSSHASRKRGSEIGRFGLGFKSVLGVTNQPQVFSRSGSFGFNALRSAQAIREIVPEAVDTPVLRLAWELDPLREAERDPVLKTLMGWATTVIKLPRQASTSAWLTKDIETFPHEFLLFSSHVALLSLEDVENRTVRRLRTTPSGNDVRLDDGPRTSRWRLFQTSHEPSESARKDAGILASRESVPLIWAVPDQRQTGRSHFWSFFPTEQRTSVSGILNAPWKTTDDRHSLHSGVFNRELLNAMAALIVNSLPELTTNDDPARFLDLLPAREEDASNQADQILNSAIYRLAAGLPSLPDQHGRLRRPADLRIHPASVGRAAANAWSEHPRRAVNWCHPSVETRERRPRADRLLQATHRERTHIDDWLQVLVTDRDAEASAEAIRVAGCILEHDARLVDEVRDASIVLDRSGRLHRAHQGVIFMAPDDASPAQATINIVHPSIAQHADVREVLSRLGVTEASNVAPLESLLHPSGIQGIDRDDWPRFWRMVQSRPSASLRLLENHRSAFDHIHVKTCDGQFHRIGECLLPGTVVPTDASRDARFTINTQFHAEDLHMLTFFGAVGGPTQAGQPRSGNTYDRYRAYALECFHASNKHTGARPREALIDFDDAPSAGPISLLPALSDTGKAAYTEQLLTLADQDGMWTIRHTTQTRYQPVKVLPPSLWGIKQFGLLPTAAGPRPARTCLHPALREWKDVLPVAQCSEYVADSLHLSRTLDHVSSEDLLQALEVLESIDDMDVIGRTYVLASTRLSRPSRLRCQRGVNMVTLGPDDVDTAIVVSHDHNQERVIRTNLPFIVVESPIDAATLRTRWSLRDAPEDRREVRAVQSGSAFPVIDRFPALSSRVAADIRIVPCSTIHIAYVGAAGTIMESVDHDVSGDTIHIAGDMDDAGIVNVISNALRLKLTAEEALRAVRSAHIVAATRQDASIRALGSNAERLLAAVGADAIRSRLPEGLIDTARHLVGIRNDVELAELAIHVYGDDVLRALRDEFQAAGFLPPQRWAESKAAREFTERLGFPIEWAGKRGSRREARLEVVGPQVLPPLHPYQSSIVTGIRRVLKQTDVKRAMVSLPTGAGKTRVAVQAITEAIRDDGLAGPILWIAQSDELCEQAVRSWNEVWSALGSRDTLRISRLWDSNEADPWHDGPHVVIATIKKLEGRINDTAYRWLANAGCVVIDEAHHAIAPTYTEVLRWQGISGQPSRRDRCPLIGLSATAFRGGEDETRSLVNRFGGVRVDKSVLGEDPYGQLQDLRVLAEVDHKVLHGAADFRLNLDEQAHARQLHVLPDSASRRLGNNPDRNKELLDDLYDQLTRHPDWTALLFATSVNHAQIMAALLNRVDIPARAVTSDTNTHSRRRYVEQFRAGELRVLTNYGTLTTGFDAPKVDAIFVARPAFSPVIYQQMIGRGLRGPLNGGKERCLIVNVRDNFHRYGLNLAFTEFEYLWNRSPPRR